jgi:K+:H+ antiporter
VTSVSLGAVMFPFVLGCLLALYLAGRQPTPDRVGFVLFLGTALSITAFPVLARILQDSGLVGTTVGGLALACAAVDDVLAWSLLAVVVAISGANGQLWLALLVVPFAGLLITVVRPLLCAAKRRLGASRLGDFAVLAIAGTGLFLGAQATDRMGLHLIFGAFLFGIAFPRGSDSRRCARLLGGAERLNALLLLPVFFLIVGLQFDLVRLDTEELAVFALILAVAVGGKTGGAFVGARLCGAGSRHAVTLAVLLNTRGLTEMIALTTGVQLGLLDTGLYSQMVVMALVTTSMTGVLLRFVYPPERVRDDIVARETAGVPT